MNKTLLLLSALTLTAAAPGGPARADDAMAGMNIGGAKTAAKPAAAPLSVTATVSPAAPQAGDNTLALTVLDAGGKPATGLKLTASVAMTSMDMGTTHPAFAEAGAGRYTAKVNFSMNGPWRVVVRSGTAKVAVLNFEAGAKAPWKSPAVKAAAAAPAKADAPAADPMPGMDMSAPAATPATAPPPAKAAKPVDQPAAVSNAPSMTGMDMKTATVPELQETGTYTATGNEDWAKQTGFGHNAGMVAMMNQMMVGGSGMEGMKMPAMNMKFDEQNYAKPGADDADAPMPGMDMGGAKAAGKKAGPGDMAGMKMDAAPTAPKPDAPAGDMKAMPGMSMDAAPKPGPTPAAPAPAKIAATMASAPKSGDNSLLINITDAQGKPVTGAAITTSVAMTSMDMGTTHPAVAEKGGGKYAATVNFSMAGPWRIKLKVTAPGQKPQTKAFDFSAK